MKEITKAQQRVLERWCAHIARHGTTPTVRSVMVELGFASTNSIISHLTALERAALLERSDGTWVPTDEGWTVAGWRPPRYERIQPLVPATEGAPSCEGEVLP